MDELAYALKIDPLELRLINYAEVDPESGKPWSSKALRECYRLGAEKFGWERRSWEPRSMRDGDVLVGYGMATWARAQDYKRRWDRYEKDGGEPPARDMAMDTLRKSWKKQHPSFDEILDAFARVIEQWLMHFFAVKVKVKPIRKIDEPRWAWHIGLDAESTAILNELWAGNQVDAGRMRNILALFALDFDDAAAMRQDIAGRTVYLALSADEQVVRMKPQNLLLNLPLNEA